MRWNSTENYFSLRKYVMSKSICKELVKENGEQTYSSHLPLTTFSDDAHREVAKDILIEFYEYIASKKITLWPMFGTLLGMVRDNNLIPHDSDIDFGYLHDDESQFVSALDHLHETNGYLVIRNSSGTLYSVCKNSVVIDLYQYKKGRGGNAQFLLQGNRRFYDLLFEEAFPFTTISFRDKELNCINNPEAFFRRYYGHNWQTSHTQKN